MTTVERVARAIAANHNRHDFFDKPAHAQGSCPECDSVREQFREAARAALAAIEPSPEMVEAGAKNLYLAFAPTTLPWRDLTENQRAIWLVKAESVFKAEIAAALKEGGG